MGMEEREQENTEEGQEPQVGFQACTPGLSVAYILPLRIKGLQQQHLSHPERRKEGGRKREEQGYRDIRLSRVPEILSLKDLQFMGTYFPEYLVELFREVFSTTFLFYQSNSS